MPRRRRVSLAAALSATMVLVACSADQAKFLPPEVDASDISTRTFDGSLEPAAAVLPLVPQDVATLTVTDYDQVRLQMGLQHLTTADARSDRAAFWDRAEAERPLLSTGMLRPIEPKFEQDFGLSQMDVAWEAHFYDALGDEAGFVLAFRDGTDMTAAAAAVDAGFVALEGATVDADHGLVTYGTAADGDESWAADPALRPLVGLPAQATYVARGCVDRPATADVDDLGAYSVQFEGTLATARLGDDRGDLFERMRLGEGVAEFDQAYDGGVADPNTGRIGFVMSDPAAAGALAVAGRLPFAACS